ncbi:hypothetical protein RRG08_020828 [Elysia crispata]|uniref:Uncharacterized protein n=1 Tax=Elysia crispata TaxID=231223 RepID=A0AAE0XUU2_9GAST|nr:hypothetical protein RRG08_020828 [Elysia crispata]
MPNLHSRRVCVTGTRLPNSLHHPALNPGIGPSTQNVFISLRVNSHWSGVSTARDSESGPHSLVHGHCGNRAHLVSSALSTQPRSVLRWMSRDRIVLRCVSLSAATGDSCCCVIVGLGHGSGLSEPWCYLLGLNHVKHQEISDVTVGGLDLFQGFESHLWENF